MRRAAPCEFLSAFVVRIRMQGSFDFVGWFASQTTHSAQEQGSSLANRDADRLLAASGLKVVRARLQACLYRSRRTRRRGKSNGSCRGEGPCTALDRFKGAASRWNLDPIDTRAGCGGEILTNLNAEGGHGRSFPDGRTFVLSARGNI